tara:strand:+ start:3327 stop:4409 length:1083 start_codon:yes stop_codon:yes gene_type:complete
LIIIFTNNTINISSSINNYKIDFINSFINQLNLEIKAKSFIIIDSNIYKLYFSNNKINLTDNNFLIIKANEKNKSIDKCKGIFRALVKNKVRRNQRIIAVGGGIIQDITAFTASTYLRGIEWCFFPTTLLSQADSCIGGKTSINLGGSKNIIGNFYPPKEIYLDPNFLKTLSKDDIKSGIGEIFHFYFYANSKLIQDLINEYDNLLDNPRKIIRYIEESLKIKKSVIEIDEFDRGERNKFNYGHTFGHAIETTTNYKIRHGLAVTVGMDIANFISQKIGLIDSKTYESMKSILSINFPNYAWSNFDKNLFFKALSVDKKNEGNNLGCILTKGWGKLVKQSLPMDNELKKMITNYFDKEIK